MPTFKLKSDGREYTTRVPAEVTRLRLSAAYEEVGVPTPALVKDEQFHPAGKKVEEVKKHIEQNPDDAARVIAEEKAGQARPTIVAD